MTRWQITRARPKANPRAAEYRCSSCGQRTFARLFAGEWKPAACPEHRDAPILAWDWHHQAAAIAACQRFAGGGATFEDQIAELAGLVAEDSDLAQGARFRAALVVLPLLIEWGGLIERRLDQETTERPRRSLY